MAKKSLNGNPLTTNILELMYKLKEKDMLTDLEADLRKKYKKSQGYQKMFHAFNQMVNEEISAFEPNRTEGDLANEVGLDVARFNDKKQDFYDRILDYVIRKTQQNENWEKRALKIVEEVDALWDLGLRKQAEVRFLKLEKLCNENIKDEESKWRYTYLLSKIRYYAECFRRFNYLNYRDKHDRILSKEQFALIQDLENASSYLRASSRRYAEPEKWQQESIEFKVFQVLALLAKQKHNYREARGFTQMYLERFSQAKLKQTIGQLLNQTRFPDFSDSRSPLQAPEIQFAFYYYLKIEEYHLALLDNNTLYAENILNELHTILNETSEKSRHYLTGLLLYLQLDLQQAQFALMLKGYQPNEQISNFNTHFLTTNQEVANMEARMQMNRLLIQFFSTPEKPKIESLEKEVKMFEAIISPKAMSSVKLELNLLRLLIFLEGITEEGKDEYIRLVSKYAKESGRETALLTGFLKGIRKIKFPDYTHLKNELPKLASDLEKLRNPKTHIDNIIMYWLNKYPVVLKR